MKHPPAVLLCGTLALEYMLATGLVAAQVLVRHDGTTLKRYLAHYSIIGCTLPCPSSPSATFGERKRKEP